MWYRREFECYVRAEDPVEAKGAAVASESWRVASQTGDLWEEYIEVEDASDEGTALLPGVED